MKACKLMQETNHVHYKTHPSHAQQEGFLRKIFLNKWLNVAKKLSSSTPSCFVNANFKCHH